MKAFEFHPLAEIFPLMAGREFDELTAHIREQGLLEPIKLYEGKILDGRNRYRACLQIGIEPHIEEYAGNDPVGYVVGLNLARRHLSESQRAMVAAKLANMKRGRPSEKAPIGALNDAQAAELLNVSERTVERAKTVQRDAASELADAVERGKVTVSAAADIATQPKERQREIVAKGKTEILNAAKAIREEKAEVRRKELLETAMRKAEMPSGKYGVIVIDPPWPMQKIERDVRPNQVAFEYPTMTEAELFDFGQIIRDLAADDCHLFMWTTQKFLPLSLRLTEAYGFRYVLLMTWHKPGGFQPIGLPQYNCEFAVYARRGAPLFIDTKAFACCSQWPRREHSRKPDEFYELVERVTTGRRIDVFSREARVGFSQYGNEADKFDLVS